ncbi:hypothetical protein CONLIGDRAFT_222570 [Coniochaeta ligniaria NRRL 30616]|uniref:Uncharacterized protein n=1 Tax=Coniochaeta ligniaria NRRL 30616 TaxID=1408157 RepID=A0A1J7I4H2_9PEZI|nr:hypothetical protein CONLIGDRAFT_222570 [Coniochaeta ligniaria NRRL 30616]
MERNYYGQDPNIHAHAISSRYIVSIDTRQSHGQIPALCSDDFDVYPCCNPYQNPTGLAMSHDVRFDTNLPRHRHLLGFRNTDVASRHYCQQRRGESIRDTLAAKPSSISCLSSSLSASPSTTSGCEILRVFVLSTVNLGPSTEPVQRLRLVVHILHLHGSVVYASMAVSVRDCELPVATIASS